MSLQRRIQRLEAAVRTRNTGDICVWCMEREELPATIDAMIREGEIKESDRDRCKFWADARPNSPPGAYEDALSAARLAYQEDRTPTRRDQVYWRIMGHDALMGHLGRALS